MTHFNSTCWIILNSTYLRLLLTPLPDCLPSAVGANVRRQEVRGRAVAEPATAADQTAKPVQIHEEGKVSE